MTDPITRAAMWLSEQKEAPQQVVHLLRERFGITAAQAIEAVALARKFQTYRRAFG